MYWYYEKCKYVWQKYCDTINNTTKKYSFEYPKGHLVLLKLKFTKNKKSETLLSCLYISRPIWHIKTSCLTECYSCSNSTYKRWSVHVVRSTVVIKKWQYRQFLNGANNKWNLWTGSTCYRCVVNWFSECNLLIWYTVPRWSTAVSHQCTNIYV